MSSTDAAPPRLCTLKMLEESKAPHFRKTLTRTMLQRTERVGIPSWFTHKHGDRFHPVLSLMGPNGHSRPVMCIVRANATRPRVYLGQEWLAFAKENGFQMGDQVVFWLVARSCFHVLVKIHAPTFDQNLSPKDDQEPETSDDVMVLQASTQHVTAVEFSPSKLRASPRCVKYRRPPQRWTSIVGKSEYVNYPGLSSAVSSNSEFPQFVKKLGPNHLIGRDIRMELPWAFVKEHGDKFQRRVALLGASGHVRSVSLRVAIFSGIERVHLGKGWKEFTLENGFTQGDILLFSLVALSKFVVHMFPGARK